MVLATDLTIRKGISNLTLLSQIATDATNILDDETQGYSELFYALNSSNEAYGVFLDSWEETDDVRHPDLVIARTTFVLYDLDHGDLVQRASDSQTFEIYGVRPDPNGTVTLTLRRSADAFS